MNRRASATFLLLLAAIASASTAQAPVQASGTTTNVKVLKEPPYYRGDAPGQPTTAFSAVGVAGEAPGLPGKWMPLEALRTLAADMTGWLGAELSAQPVELPAPAKGSVGPRIYFGCTYDEVDGECLAAERQNALITTSPTKAWRGAVATTAASERGAPVVLEIGLAQQWIRQRGLGGKKEIRLGTGYTQPLPWLTSLDTPVWVLQIRGASLDSEGRIARAGAEGIWALRTAFSTSSVDAQRILSPADVEHVRGELRRSELPGQPLAWQVALHQLFVGLGGSASDREVD